MRDEILLANTSLNPTLRLWNKTDQLFTKMCLVLQEATTVKTSTLWLLTKVQMAAWASASAGALNTDSAYLSARWRTTAPQVSQRVCTCVGVFITVIAQSFSSPLRCCGWGGRVLLDLLVAFAARCHAELHLCLQLKLGSLWEISWWRWTGSAWRASPWAALWRSWQATTACGWWWGGWARSPASVTPKRRPHGEVKGHRWIYYVCRALIFHCGEHWDNLAWLINRGIIMKQANVPLYTMSDTALCLRFLLKLKVCVTFLQVRWGSQTRWLHMSEKRNQ